MKKRILNMLLAIVMVVGLVPGMVLTASAEDEVTSAQNINLGYSIIENGDVQNQRWDYIYFGNYSNSPLKWRVLSNTGVGDTYKDADSDAYTNGALFLMTEYALEKMKFGASNIWAGSDVQTWCNNTFADSAFSDTEKNAILLTSKSDVEEYMFNSHQSLGNIPIYAKAMTLTDEAVFFLSAKEIQEYVLGSKKVPAYNGNNQKVEYWTRTALRDYDKVFFVDGNGGLAQGSGQPTSDWAARPAFHMNASNVLLTSAAVGGKPDGFGAVQAYDGNEWKITLLDNTRSGFAAEVSKTDAKTYAVHYSGAATGSNEYISAIIVDNSNHVESYGRLCPVTSESGTTAVTLPDTFDASNDTLYIFNEQYNGDYRTDYVSNLIKAAIPAEISDVPYLDAAGEEKICQSAVPVKSDMTSLTSGWYCVNENTTISSRITVSGDVHIILCDGATLTISNSTGTNGGIDASGSKLYIYGQTEGTGELIARANKDSFEYAIGGSNAEVTINGGIVTANGGVGGHGITGKMVSYF